MSNPDIPMMKFSPEERAALEENEASGKYRVIICIPTHDNVPYQFAVDFANMLGYTLSAIGDRVDVITNTIAGTYVHKARQSLYYEALEMGCHYMLWLDSDMRFPKDLLIRLLSHNKDIVGINYSTRGVPPRFVAIKEVGAMHDGKGVLCATWPDSTGLERVEALGFGAVLMKAAVSQKMPQDEPVFWFGYDVDPEKGTYMHMGEDVYFCKLATEGGVEIYVDHDLSKECAHVGTMEFKLEHVHAMVEEGIVNVDYELRGATDGDRQLDESERPDES